MAELPPTDPASLALLSASTETTEWYTLNERCDACNSQSYFMVSFDYGNLFFCKHHFDRHEDTIFELALDVVDESELLFRG
jgi:hypothetical protein